MNTASQNPAHHLGILRERMFHPTDYEGAVHYFLEEFAGDRELLRRSEPDDAPHLRAVLEEVASHALGRWVKFDAARVFRLAEHGFFHGNAAVGVHVVLFFYFEEVAAGITAMIPGVRGAMEVGRFRLPTGLRNPRNN
jgi:hypothetical protein